MKKLSIILFVLISLLMGNISKAQNLGIGPDTFDPDASAGVEMRFTNKGLLIPRVALTSTTSTSPITTPIATSLLVYNTATAGTAPNNVTPGYYYWNGSKWMRLLSIDDKPAWLLSGNAATTPGTNFIGTTDAKDLVFKTNSAEIMRITSGGNVGVGTTGPTEKLDVAGDIRIRKTGNWSYIKFDAQTNDPAQIAHYENNNSAELWLNPSDDFDAGASNDYLIIGDIATGVKRFWFRGDGTSYLSGNVGIGTTSPTHKLHVNGSNSKAKTIVADGYIEDVGGIVDGNLVSSHCWTVGSGSVGGFSQNGTTAENVREWGVGPYGNRALLWKCVPDDSSNADGGWNFTNIPIDPNKAYRVTVWVYKTNSNNGTTYLGCDQGNTLNLNGTANGNPYFWSGDVPQLNRWYLLVGYIHANNDTSTTSYGGMYDGVTGQKVINFTDFKNSTGTTQKHRAYLFYDTDVNDRQYFYDPRFEEINGKEPSITALLGLGDNVTGSGTATRVAFWSGTNTLSSNANLYWDNTNSRLGIGTASPSTELDVAGNVNLNNGEYTSPGTLNRGYYVYKSGTTAYGIKLHYDGSQYGTMVFGPNQPNRFINFGKVGAALEDDDMIEYMRIDLDNGNVGIGTTSPAEKLHINGSIRGNQSGALRISTGYGYIDIGPQNTSWAHFYTDRSRYWFSTGLTIETGNIGSYDENLSLQTSGTTRITVLNSNGNVGIGTVSPTAKLHVAGNIKTNTINETSDARFKKNIQNINTPLSKVLSLRGVYYYWDLDNPDVQEKDTSKQIGMIAQEVEKILPELVNTDSDGYKSVEYSRVVAVLIEAMKEQQKVIEQQNSILKDQENTIKEQKDMINNLNERLSKLEELIKIK